MKLSTHAWDMIKNKQGDDKNNPLRLIEKDTHVYREITPEDLKYRILWYVHNDFMY